MWWTQISFTNCASTNRMPQLSRGSQDCGTISSIFRQSRLANCREELSERVGRIYKKPSKSITAFDELRAALAANRPQFYKDLTLPFYGYNRPAAKISEGIREHWWLQAMLGGVKPHYDCIKAFSETDFTEDLKKIDIPVLVMHGDDDQIVPIAAAGLMSAKILKKATLKVYPGFPHGMPTTNADQINADLLAFCKGSATTAAA